VRRVCLAGSARQRLEYVRLPDHEEPPMRSDLVVNPVSEHQLFLRLVVSNTGGV
jgi:hypothetical protein